LDKVERTFSPKSTAKINVVKKTIKGNKTRIQDTLVYPALQRRSRIKVQKATKVILNRKTKMVLGTIQLYFPTQYFLVLPKFWILRITIPITESTK
jgi:hypothetical protein